MKKLVDTNFKFIVRLLAKQYGTSAKKIRTQFAHEIDRSLARDKRSDQVIENENLYRISLEICMSNALMQK